MLRFVFQVSRLDGNTGLKTKGIETVDIDVPVLEGMLIKGGLSENSYEVHDLFGVEILTGKGVAAQENKESGEQQATAIKTPAAPTPEGEICRCERNEQWLNYRLYCYLQNFDYCPSCGKPL